MQMIGVLDIISFDRIRYDLGAVALGFVGYVDFYANLSMYTYRVNFC